jgi:hypothetical protein
LVDEVGCPLRDRIVASSFGTTCQGKYQLQQKYVFPETAKYVLGRKITPVNQCSKGIKKTYVKIEKASRNTLHTIMNRI